MTIGTLILKKSLVSHVVEFTGLVELRLIEGTLFKILNALFRGFQMRYHLSQKFFGKMVEIKETSLLSQPC